MSDLPRDLTREERELLDLMIESDDDAPRLRRLLSQSQVTGECRCGCGSLELTVDSTAAEHEWPEEVWHEIGLRNAPRRLEARADIGERGGLLVLLHVARTDAQLELVWGDRDLKGTPLPAVSEFRIKRWSSAGDGQSSR